MASVLSVLQAMMGASVLDVTKSEEDLYFSSIIERNGGVRT
jgi:hypothetical protein